MKRRCLTLIEVPIVIGFIAATLSLLLPALHGARLENENATGRVAGGYAGRNPVAFLEGSF